MSTYRVRGTFENIGISNSRFGDTRVNIAKFLFFFLFIFSYLNIGALWVKFNLPDIPLNPIVFFVVFFIVLFQIRTSISLNYLKVSWIFLITFTLLGFFGPRFNGEIYNIIQNTLKMWIVVVGMPLLAIICIRTKEEANFYFNTLIWLGIFTTILLFYQLYNPSLFEKILSDERRPSGLWINPNITYEILYMTLLVTFLPKINKSHFFLVTIRIIIISGIIITFSRTSILLLIIVALLYLLIIARKISIPIILGLLIVILITDFNVEGENIDQEGLNRFGTLVRIFQGDAKAIQESGRFVPWTYSLAEIGNDWFLGLGHDSMDRIVQYGGGLGPHNYFIWVLGNSGFIALIIFIIWLYQFIKMGQRMSGKYNKLIFLSLGYGLILISIVSHGYLRSQPVGGVLCIFIAYYAILSKTTLLKDKVVSENFPIESKQI